MPKLTPSFVASMRYSGFLRELERLPQSHPDWETLSAAYRALILLDFVEEEGAAPSTPQRVEMPAVSTGSHSETLRAAVAAWVDAVAAYRREDAQSRQHVLSTMDAAIEEVIIRCYPDATMDLAEALLRLDGEAPSRYTWRAHARRASAHMYRGCTDAALDEYQEGLVAAAEVGDGAGVIRCRGDIAKMRGMRGNLPAAEETLRDLLEQAKSAEMGQEAGIVAGHLGMVVGMSGRPREALEILEYAVEHSIDTNRKESALVNLALTRAILGETELATRMLEGVVAEGRCTNVLAISRGHLTELYAKAGRRDEIDDLLQATHLDALPIHPRAYVEVSAGRAFKILGDVDASARWLTAALADAEASELGSLAFEIAEELDGLLGKSWRKHRSTPMTAAAPVPLNLPPVARPAVQESQLDTSKQEAGTPTR